jgi:hypothetical protein
MSDWSTDIEKRWQEDVEDARKEGYAQCLRDIHSLISSGIEAIDAYEQVGEEFDNKNSNPLDTDDINSHEWTN